MWCVSRCRYLRVIGRNMINGVVLKLQEGPGFGSTIVGNHIPVICSVVEKGAGVVILISYKRDCNKYNPLKRILWHGVVASPVVTQDDEDIHRAVWVVLKGNAVWGNIHQVYQVTVGIGVACVIDNAGIGGVVAIISVNHICTFRLEVG